MKRTALFAIAFAALLGAAAPNAAAAPDPGARAAKDKDKDKASRPRSAVPDEKVVQAVRADGEPITIDGRLDERVWKTAAAATNTASPTGSSSASTPTSIAAPATSSP